MKVFVNPPELEGRDGFWGDSSIFCEGRDGFWGSLPYFFVGSYPSPSSPGEKNLKKIPAMTGRRSDRRCGGKDGEFGRSRPKAPGQTLPLASRKKLGTPQENAKGLHLLK